MPATTPKPGSAERPLRIVFAAADTRPERWLEEIPLALAQQGLHAQVQVYQPGQRRNQAWALTAPPGYLPGTLADDGATSVPVAGATASAPPSGTSSGPGREAEHDPGQAPPIDSADYALVWKPPSTLFAEHPGLRGVFNLGAGVDGVLRIQGLPDQVPLVRLDDAGMAEQMADYVLAAVLRWYRRFDAYQRQQHEQRWHLLKPVAKAEFKIGLLGYGVLGQRVAQALRAMGFPVQAWRRSPAQPDDAADGVHICHGTDGLHALMSSSRVVVCLLPLTPTTRGLLNYDTLSLLPPSSWLINVARGAHVVEKDLLELLDIGHLAGALLDVFGAEPLPAEDRLWRHPRVQITPHVAALTRRDMALEQIAGKIAALERGEPISGVVDRRLGY